MKNMFPIIILISFFVLQSCAIYKKESEIRQQDLRVKQKEDEYGDLKKIQNKLESEKNSLINELRSEEITDRELLHKLETIIELNSQIIANNDSQRLEKAKIDNRLRCYKDEILNIRNDDEVTMEEKKQRIDELKLKIKAYALYGIK